MIGLIIFKGCAYTVTVKDLTRTCPACLLDSLLQCLEAGLSLKLKGQLKQNRLMCELWTGKRFYEEFSISTFGG